MIQTEKAMENNPPFAAQNGMMNPPEDNNNKIPLSAGNMINARFGWEAVIEKVDKSKYKLGQGITVRRLTDGAIFSICPADIKTLYT